MYHKALPENLIWSKNVSVAMSLNNFEKKKNVQKYELKKSRTQFSLGL